MDETIGVDGAGSSSGIGPVAGEGEIGVRGEAALAAKGLRRNILVVAGVASLSSKNGQSRISSESEIGQCCFRIGF